MYNPYGFMTPPQQTVPEVNGKPGVDAYQMGPNSSVLLLDKTAPIVWLKTTDSAGYATATAYDITPHKSEAQQMEERYVTKEDFNALSDRVNKLLEDLGDDKSNS